MKFYSYTNIDKTDAVYKMIIGERSNGKTYGALKKIVENYYAKRKQGALIRRWDEDLKGKRGQAMFESLVSNDEITKITHGMWTGVYYYSGRWYLCRYEDDNRITDDTPFCYGFSLSAMEHDKSTSYPDITTVVFDEFLSRTSYLPDEFVLFCNVLSTIIRHRTDVIIYMLGNTVNKYCPYFNEMGLKHVKDMEQGTIDVYSYGKDGKLKVAVEYCKPFAKGKPSDFYFNFDNSALKMITGGAWEIAVYPHLPVKYKPKDVLYRFYISFDGENLQCNVIHIQKSTFIYIHRKTTPLKNESSDLIFSPEYCHTPNWRRKINKPYDKIGNKIAELFKKDKVFYSSNEVGEIVRNYLLWCG